MEPLFSSFAVNIATGIALNLYESYTNDVDKQIKSSFSAALKNWSKNEKIRNRNEFRFTSLLKDYIINSDGTINEDTNKEIIVFFEHFSKKIAEKSAASNYLQSINNKNRYDEITNKLTAIDEKITGLSELIKSANIDPRDVERLLNKMPFDKGKEEVENTIHTFYQQKGISLALKEILLVAAKKIYERTDELSKEIKYLKSKGDTYLAETLEKIKTAVEKREPNALLNIYQNYNQREKENKIGLLNELIKSSNTIFAYNEAIKFYSELIDIEPSANNHFNFAFFLQEFIFFDEAIKQYEEALKIYRELAKENPRTYLPYMATTLNNLAVLQKAKNEFPQALEKYEEALKIRRELAKENPRTYEIDYVQMLVMGVVLFKKDKCDLKKAKRILEKYLSVYKAQKLLELIKGLE